MGRKYSEIMRKLSIREFTDHSIALINLWVLFSCFFYKLLNHCDRFIHL